MSFDQPLRDARDAFEKAYLEYQLEKHSGNVSQMAEEAGMERNPPVPQAARPRDRDQRTAMFPAILAAQAAGVVVAHPY